jgi:hypothetical protein
MVRKIPEDHWTGKNCLKNRLPWLVPESIIELDKWLTKDDVVVEFGSGGSTLFFADRCKKVVSFEFELKWKERLQGILGRENNMNVDYYKVDNLQHACDTLIAKYPNQKFNVVNLDCKDNRDLFKEHLIQFLAERFLIILDNYSHEYLFPASHNSEYVEGLPIKAWWRTYPDENWVTNGWGEGTKLYSNEFAK